MPTFKCRVAVGGGRIVEKTLDADSIGALKKKFEEEGKFLIGIERGQRAGALGVKLGGKRSVKSGEFYSFNQEFSVLIGAGLPIIAALDAILENGDTSYLNVLLKEIRTAIVRGESLSSAFGEHSHVFSKLYVASLRAGEKSGNIPLAIARYIDYMKRSRAIRQKVISASIYPAILTVVSTLVLIFLLVFVVPSITTTFLETGSELPLITALLVAVSDALVDAAHYLVMVLAGVILFVFHWRKTDRGTLFLDRMKLTLPFLRELNVSYAVTRFGRTLSTVLAGGTPLVESVRIAADTLDNRFLKIKLGGVVKRLEQGDGFAYSMKSTGVFPGLAVRMIAAGEGGGSLEKVLGDIAEFYESDVESRLAVLTSAIEPALMIIMGALIGFIVLAMYMPVFQMAGTMG